jgi:hypothetical protein
VQALAVVMKVQTLVIFGGDSPARCNPIVDRQTSSGALLATIHEDVANRTQLLQHLEVHDPTEVARGKGFGSVQD